MFYIFLCDFKKIIKNKDFFISIGVIFLLCFTSHIHTDIATGKEYSVIDIFFELRSGSSKIPSAISSMYFTAANICAFPISTYLTLFIPILSAYPFVTTFISERNSGNIRFAIFRTGRYKYFASKALVAFATGGLVVSVGCVLYCVALLFMFPVGGMSVFIGNLVKSISGIALFGGMSAIPAFLITSFIRNKHIVICLPFMLIYIYLVALQNISSRIAAGVNYNIYIELSFLQPSNLYTVFSSPVMVIQTVIFNMILLIFSFFGYAVIMNRRFDSGD
ncbi:MAG: hypothetical protein FWG90_07760 [Oscillospiraceae bacterium]|nr:hypothetical protein [Oscillospiraceae bacterium]